MKKIYLLLACLAASMSLLAQDYSQVYIIGGATPNGWANDMAQEMTLVQDDDENAVFTWSGILKNGDFKFINFLNTWDPCFNATSADEAVVLGQTHALAYNENGANDHKFIISAEGFYKITVNLKKLTMVVEETTLELPEELWVTGTAIPGGVAKLITGHVTGSFMYIGELLQGEYKIITTETIGESTQYIVPIEEDVDVTGETGLQITDDETIPGWNVTVDDPDYKVKINIISEKSNGEIFIPRDNLYIIGGATTAGWNTGEAIPFVKNPANPFEFIFDGELKVRPENEESNLFKILGQQDWEPYSLHPFTAEEPIIGSQYVLVSTGDDKWSVNNDQQGRYVIKVNVLYETIEAEYKGLITSQMQPEMNNYYGLYSSNGDIRVVVKDNCIMEQISVFDLNGKMLADKQPQGNDFLLANNLTKGIYIVKAKCNNEIKVQKIIVS